MSNRNKIGFWLGIPLFFGVLFFPFSESLSPEAQRTLAVAVLMACWWITEAIPIPATALVPIVAFPFLKILPAGKVVTAYADSNIFLFLGGFLLAITMQRWELHRRIALRLIRRIGLSPGRLIFGFMIATAFLSMWISNTATTMMMYPIGLAIILQISEMKSTRNQDLTNTNFETVLMLAIAYAASIGGVGTLIGTPPNIVFAAAVRSIFPEAPEIGFFQWLLVGVPLVVVFIPVTWLFLTKIALRIRHFPTGDGKEVIDAEIGKLGNMSRAEKYTLAVFLLTAFGWIFRQDIELGIFTIHGWSNLLGIQDHVNDATVAIFASILLFLIPVNFKKKEFLLNWEWAVRIPWGILILFGGGIALAIGFKSSGLAEWIGNNLSFFSNVPLLIMIVITCLMMTFLTEVTSNTATSTIFMPILAVTALAMNIHPYLLMIPATISASCAFMLPVATPPNAIIFGSGTVSIPQMAKAGVGLNFIGVLMVTTITYIFAIPVFGILFNQLPIWAK
ncbi:DASS family sodium-coupled anion symporter [candidate division KSB1 bacterium]|nr:DASS family sodium-coupled anion symporter [candidate division KSB1 bacterium]